MSANPSRQRNTKKASWDLRRSLAQYVVEMLIVEWAPIVRKGGQLAPKPPKIPSSVSAKSYHIIHRIPVVNAERFAHSAGRKKKISGRRKTPFRVSSKKPVQSSSSMKENSNVNFFMSVCAAYEIVILWAAYPDYNDIIGHAAKVVETVPGRLFLLASLFDIIAFILLRIRKTDVYRALSWFRQNVFRKARRQSIILLYALLVFSIFLPNVAARFVVLEIFYFLFGVYLFGIALWEPDISDELSLNVFALLACATKGYLIVRQSPRIYVPLYLLELLNITLTLFPVNSCRKLQQWAATIANYTYDHWSVLITTPFWPVFFTILPMILCTLFFKLTGISTIEDAIGYLMVTICVTINSAFPASYFSRYIQRSFPDGNDV